MSKVSEGQGYPALILRVNEDLASAHLHLQRQDGHAIDLRAGAIAKGGEHRFELKQPRGTFSYRGKLAVSFQNGASGAMPVSFSAIVQGPLKIEVPRDKLDLEAHRLSFRLDRPAGKLLLEVTGDRGEELGRSEVAFHGEAPGQLLSVTWNQRPGTVIRVRLTAYDDEGFYSTLELYPWQVDIPHEEILFATGSAVVTADEQPKLQQTHQRLKEAIDRYGSIVKVKLYIAGHTDTVGDKESNRRLSRARAKAIGQFFRDQGVQIPIYYQGFGEDRLAVSTPDQTDEARNRRAEYILAAEDPFLGQPGGTTHWIRLP